MASSQSSVDAEDEHRAVHVLGLYSADGRSSGRSSLGVTLSDSFQAVS
ncbi:MAG: hypothetical protein U0745_03595 [Polyangia bacterium]